MSIDRAELTLQFRQGRSLGFAYLLEGSAFAVTGLMLGWFGATALAAFKIVESVAGVLYMMPLGMATAVAVRIGKVTGAEQTERPRVIGLTALVLVFGWMVLVTGALLVWGDAIAARLSTDPAVVKLAGILFIMVALVQLIDGLQSTALGALRGLMDHHWPASICIVAYWVVSLPLAYLIGFVFDAGPVGVWVAMPLDCCSPPSP